MTAELARYFPRVLTERFAERMESHRLRRELIATYVTNSLVNRAGITFAFRIAEETGAGADEIARGLHGRARGLRPARALDVDRGARRRHPGRRPARHAPRGAEARGARDALAACGAARGRSTSPPRSSASPRGRRSSPTRSAAFCTAPTARRSRARPPSTSARACPRSSPRRVAGLGAMFSALDIVEVAGTTGAPLEEVATVYHAVGARLQLQWLARRDHRPPAGQPLADPGARLPARRALRRPQRAHAGGAPDRRSPGSGPTPAPTSGTPGTGPASTARSRSSPTSAWAGSPAWRRCRSRCARCAT